MKRNLRKLLLTRVYNGRSTTIFCVTSVTRRLLDTTTINNVCLAHDLAKVSMNDIGIASSANEQVVPVSCLDDSGSELCVIRMVRHLVMMVSYQSS